METLRIQLTPVRQAWQETPQGTAICEEGQYVTCYGPSYRPTKRFHKRWLDYHQITARGDYVRLCLRMVWTWHLVVVNKSV